jgi:glycerophosphoryl diester phosphodiesterase
LRETRSKDFRTPLILGHRGASALAPENTLAAFALAIEHGADGIEFDVRLSRDGVPVVIHDPTLNRTGLKAGLVRDLTAAELQDVDVGSWFDQRTGLKAFSREKLPTLAQVFVFFRTRDALLYVEMKCDRDEGASLASAVVREIRGHEMKDRVVVESFDLAAIEEIKRIDSSIKTAALFEPKLSKPVTTIRAQSILKAARRCEADEIALHHTLARKGILGAAKEEGFEVVVWTVDDPAWINRARAYDIRALIANNPRALVEFRDQSNALGSQK